MQSLQNAVQVSIQLLLAAFAQAPSSDYSNNPPADAVLGSQRLSRACTQGQQVQRARQVSSFQ